LFIAIAGELQQICSDEGADTTGDLCKIQIQYHKPLTNKQSCLQASGSGSPPCGKTSGYVLVMMLDAAVFVILD
jgi:hypothetical protein